MPVLFAHLAVAAALAAPGAAPSPPAVVGERPVDPYVQSDANAGTTPLSNTATFEAFHGLEGVRRIAANFVDLNVGDPRMNGVFATTDTVRLKRVLAEQFCYILGGGCAYTGRDMAQSHRHQGLQTSDFNAVVENLQIAMDRERVPFRAQNVLLAKLAPMERTVVERKSPAALKSLGRRLASLRAGG